LTAFLENEKETTMKARTISRISVAAAGLAIALLLPATTRAQAEVSPDFYELDTAQAAPAPTAQAIPVTTNDPAQTRAGRLHEERVQSASLAPGSSRGAWLVCKAVEARALASAYMQKLNSILFVEARWRGGWVRGSQIGRVAISFS
jgi:hypothetical protein